MSVVPAEVVDAKTGAEESLFVFPVAQGVVVTRSWVLVDVLSRELSCRAEHARASQRALESSTPASSR